MAEEPFIVKLNMSDEEEESTDFHLQNGEENDIVRDLDDMRVPYPTPEQKTAMCKEPGIIARQRIKNFVKENHYHHYLYYERVGWEKCNIKPLHVRAWKHKLRKGVKLSTSGVQTSGVIKKRKPKKPRRKFTLEELEVRQLYTNEEFDFIMYEMNEKRKIFTLVDLTKETGLNRWKLRRVMEKTNWVKEHNTYWVKKSKNDKV